ncbi:MAG: hypothetical protein BJ554DRAFT_2118 [Olpidium bornovanus]|uniref:Uncharacterized protein n=1 Tax=Olpidium bornovanus TaxID=278681 RepID=A0A8H7ZRA3_9FUNG|nr:MAG: hypothetical protein BJ554DRAFT_2118 [Olpidium bornovanus]
MAAPASDVLSSNACPAQPTTRSQGRPRNTAGSRGRGHPRAAYGKGNGREETGRRRCSGHRNTKRNTATRSPQ